MGPPESPRADVVPALAGLLLTPTKRRRSGKTFPFPPPTGAQQWLRQRRFLLPPTDHLLGP